MLPNLGTLLVHGLAKLSTEPLKLGLNVTVPPSRIMPWDWALWFGYEPDF